MIPQEIAREAARRMLVKVPVTQEHLEECVGFNAALILTAAAKMVKESGAVEALEDSSCFWQAVGAHYGPDHLCRDAEAKSLAIRDAALTKLRAIGEGKP